MLHRLFFSVPLPKETRNSLHNIKEEFSELPAKWIEPKNLHTTLLFYGNASDKEVQEITRIAQSISLQQKPFSVIFSQITYGPSKTDPRMVWAEGNPPKEFISLHNNLQKELANSSLLKFTPDPKPAYLHCTMARLEEMRFKALELEERPQIEKGIMLSVPILSFELIESKFTKGGTKYTILDSFQLS